MDRNSTQGMLKLILAGVVLILIVAVASYMNLSKSTSSNDLDEVISALLPNQVSAASLSIPSAKSYCAQPVVRGTSMTPSQIAAYSASMTVLAIETPARWQPYFCSALKGIMMRMPDLLNIIETGRNGAYPACDVPNTLAESQYPVVCR